MNHFHDGVKQRPDYESCVVQCPQRLAWSGMLIAHCGQSFVVGAAGGAGFSNQWWMLRTSKKTQKATIRKLMIVFRNTP